LPAGVEPEVTVAGVLGDSAPVRASMSYCETVLSTLIGDVSTAAVRAQRNPHRS